MNEVTELLAIKEFRETFKEALFYEPPALKGTKKEQRPVYLMDIFTIWSGAKTINPWLLSDSICAIVGLMRAQVGDIPAREKEVEQLLKGIKSIEGDLKITWEKVLQKLYGKELKAVPNDFVNLLAHNFEAKTFGVLSYGTVEKLRKKFLQLLNGIKMLRFLIP